MVIVPLCTVGDHRYILVFAIKVSFTSSWATPLTFFDGHFDRLNRLCMLILLIKGSFTIDTMLDCDGHGDHSITCKQNLSSWPNFLWGQTNSYSFLDLYFHFKWIFIWLVENIGLFISKPNKLLLQSNIEQEILKQRSELHSIKFSIVKKSLLCSWLIDKIMDGNFLTNLAHHFSR